MKAGNLISAHVRGHARYALTLNRALALVRSAILEHDLPTDRFKLYQKMLRSEGKGLKFVSKKRIIVKGKPVIQVDKRSRVERIQLTAQAWKMLDQVEHIRSLATKDQNDKFGGACVALGILMNNFTRTFGGGPSTKEPMKIAEAFYLEQRRNGKTKVKNQDIADYVEKKFRGQKQPYERSKSYQSQYSGLKRKWEKKLTLSG